MQEKLENKKSYLFEFVYILKVECSIKESQERVDELKLQGQKNY